MSLVVPGVGTEAGPTYATDINNSLTIIDAHTHSLGSGVQITPSGLNINSDLSVQGNNITLIKTNRFNSQTIAIPNSGSNVGCLYVAGNELYYNDFTGGNQVQLTASGSVNATSSGISSGTASASFSGGVLVVLAAALTSANIDAASYVFRNNTPSSFGLTLQPPNSLAANYSLTLPAIPSQTNVMTLDVSGNMGSTTWDAVGQNMTATGANAIAAARTRSVSASVPIGGVAISSSCGAYSTLSGTFVPVTNLSVTIVTSGRPVKVQLMSDPNATPSTASVAAALGNDLGQLQFVRAAQAIGEYQIGGASGGLPTSSFSTVDAVGAGSHTYTVELKINGGGGNIVFLYYAVLVAYEL